MSVRTDVVNLVVNVNGNQAQNNLNQLRKKAADLSFEMKGLKKNTEEYRKKAEELKGVTAQMDALKKQIGITALSQRELVAEMNKLKALRSSVVPFSKEYKDLDKQLQAVELRLKQVRTGVQDFSLFNSKIATVTKSIGLFAAGFIGFEFLSNAIGNAVRALPRLTDQLADLQRVANLSQLEVQELELRLRAIDSRTSMEGLREIAIIAGKLGIEGVDNLANFTAAVDKLVVALGDELGDAGQVTDQLGKILNVFEGKITAENITRAGNALVDLANKGVASGSFIVDFTQRLGGLAKTANFSLPDIFALGAGIEELGGRSESSSTAVSKLINTIAANLPKAAKIANVDLKTFSQLFAEKPAEALLLYAKGLVANKAAFSDIVTSMKDAGEEGARVISTITLLGNNTQMFTDKLNETATAYKNTTAIQNAFALKNQTLGAELDKLTKSFSNFFSNSVFANFLRDIVSGLNGIIQPTKSATEEFNKLQQEVQSLERDILPLADRYDFLKSKTILNRDEQAELKSIITQVAGVIPGAISQFDEYGNAIAINTGRVRDFIEAEKARLKVVNASAIDENQKRLSEVERRIGLIKRDIQSIEQTGTFRVTEGFSGGTGGGSSSSRNATQAEIRNQQELYKNLIQQRLGYNQEIKRLNGELLDELTKQNEPKKEEGGSGSGGSSNFTSTVKPDNDFEKRRQAFIKELERFRREAEIAGKTADEQEIARIEEKYRELLQKAKEFAYGELEIEGMKQAEIERLVKKGVQSRIAAFNEDQYKTQLEANTDFFNKQRQQQAQFYNTGQIDKETYENNLTQLERDETANRVKIAGIYSKTVKQAAEDLKNFKKNQEQQITKDLLDEVERRKRIQEQRLQNNVYNAQRNVLTTQPGTKQNLEAKKALLQAEFELETASLQKKEELYLLKDAELKQKLKEAEEEYWQGLAEKIIGYANIVADVFASVFQIINNIEERNLLRERRNNEKRKESYKKQLDNKLINQAQYDLRIQQMDQQLEEKQREAKRRQAKREKALGIFNATINTAAAIIKMLADPGGIAGTVLSVLAGVTGALQIAAIASAPLPEFGRGDWLRNGKKHSEGGIPVEVERNEAIMAAAAMTDPTRYIVSGTPAQITSALNSTNGGNSWAAGAKIIPAWQSEGTPMVRSSMPGIMAAANGGGGAAAVDMEGTNALLAQLISEQQETRNQMNQWQSEFQVVFSYKEFRQKAEVYDQAQKVAAIKQK